MTVGRQALPLALATAPLAFLGLAVMSASVVELVYAQRGEYVGFLLLGLALLAMAFLLYGRIWRTWSPLGRLAGRVGASLRRGGRRRYDAVWLTGGVSLLLALRFWTNPWATADLVGTVGTYAAFALALTLPAYGLARLEQRWFPPPALAVLGFRRIPMVLLLAVWAVSASFLDTGGYHDVRVQPTARAGQSGATLREAWRTWLHAQVGDRRVRDGRRAIPLVLVAASGGGIRAAYWTARAMDCAIDGDPAACRHGVAPRAPGTPTPVFAASGASGGSVGLAAYAAHVVSEERGDWPLRRLGEDFLASTWAWTLYVDLPNAFLRIDPGWDRAEVLERAWEQAWRQRDRSLETVLLKGGPPSDGPLTAGLRTLWHSRRDVPLLLLNGTSVEDACRVNVSVLDADIELTGARAPVEDCLTLAPFDAERTRPTRDPEWALAATEDVEDLLCEGDDLRLSSAALLSARFPYVSPSGRLRPCAQEAAAAYVVDGGYFDNTAASGLLELWARLKPLVAAHNRQPGRDCVVPLFLQIDNHYAEARETATRPPFESQVPLRAFGGVAGAREADARQAAAILFSEDSFPGVSSVEGPAKAGLRRPIRRYAHLYPRSHPGTKAPLGWTLSEVSMRDLDEQLERANRRGLMEVRRWFDKRMTCAR